MPRFKIGTHTYLNFPVYRILHCTNDLVAVQSSDINDRIKKYDNILHKSLDEIYNERCSNSSGHQIKKLRRDPHQYNNDWKLIIKPILEQEPILSKQFTKEELEKFSLLWIAVLGCYHQSAELLVRSGADVNEPFGCHDPRMIDEKWTVLHVLLQMCPSPENKRLIRMIVDHGANLHIRDNSGCTVLKYAVSRGRVSLTEMLLEKGVDVNVANNFGMTPLFYAIAYYYSDIANKLVSLLVEHGADIFVINNNSENVLHYLTKYVPERNAVDLTKFFLDKGVSFDEEDDIYHLKPLHLAATFGKSTLLKIYLDHGVNVNMLTRHGQSPLYSAAQNIKTNTVAVVESLIKRGANVHLRTKQSNHTALHAICASFSHNKKCCEIIIRLLLTAGADVLAEDCNGNTPLAFRSSRRNGEQPGQETRPLIEALALKKALQPSIRLKDKMIIERYQNLQDYFQKCTDEIERMKSTKFIESCSFFELFAKSRCEIAAFMCNPEFETKFTRYDLNNEFSIYAGDARRAFERAQKLYQSMLENEKLLNEAVYNMLPYVVMRSIVHYMSI